MLRAELEHGTAPWKHTALSGFIVDPDRKKMSKSKGNVVTPADILHTHGSDAVRYWAASSRLGSDAAFDPQNPNQIKIGRKLAIKVLNAAKFILTFEAGTGVDPAQISDPVDLSMLSGLASVVRDATAALDAYDHARALETAEAFFWTFCDDYLELVKERAYDSGSAGSASAVAALRLALSVLLRLFAPVIPFATEEAWSWFNDASIHRAPWPLTDELPASDPGADEGELLALAGRALIGIRRAKTDAKVSQKTPVDRATIVGTAEQLEAIEHVESDLRSVGRISRLEYRIGEDLAVTEIVLGATPVDAGNV
jgi:valyl-tRNA synthetase